MKTQLKLCYQYIHCKRKKYGLSDLLFPNSKWFWPCPHVSGYFWIRILFFLDMPFIHAHASAESDLRIRKLLNLLSRVETFESDIVSDTCGRSNPKTFESDDVAWLGPVSTVILTAWLQNNMAAWPKCFSVFARLRVLGKTDLYSRLSLKFYILYTLLVGVRPHHRSK